MLGKAIYWLLGREKRLRLWIQRFLLRKNEENSQKVILTLQKDCIHEKFSVMKELTANDAKNKKKEVSFQQMCHCSSIREYTVFLYKVNKSLKR